MRPESVNGQCGVGAIEDFDFDPAEGGPIQVILGQKPTTTKRWPGMQQPASTATSQTNSSNHHNVSRISMSQTTSPYLSPQSSGFAMPQFLGITRKRLLMPTVRRSSDGNSPQPASKHASRVARSASGSTSHHSSPDPGATPRPLTWTGREWIGADCRFEILEELELEGYQIYAVEKWCVALWLPPMP